MDRRSDLHQSIEDGRTLLTLKEMTMDNMTYEEAIAAQEKFYEELVERVHAVGPRRVQSRVALAAMAWARRNGITQLHVRPETMSGKRKLFWVD